MDNSIAVDDVTKKIKTAITNKLIDLGSYVDEELPDYIMVMVANKKTQRQMSNDLNLFLGSNTDNFTAWLHGILDTVQSESEDTKKDYRNETKQDSIHIGNQKTREKSPYEFNKISSKDKSHSPEKELETIPLEINLKSFSRSPEKVIVSSTSDNIREETDDVISFRTETDDILTKELQQDEENVLSSTKIMKSRRPSTNIMKAEITNKRVQISYPKSVKSTSLPKAAIKIRPMLHRKGKSSTVSSVIRKPQRIKSSSYRGDEEDDDEEYDPCKPAVGTVASVVRVTERKSSIPPELQANKLLLFKAIDDANKSITNKPGTRGSARVAPYKPTPIEQVSKKPVLIPVIESLKENSFKEVEVKSREIVQVVTPMKNVKPACFPTNVENVINMNEQVIQEVLEEMDEIANLEKPSEVVISSPIKNLKRKINEDSIISDINLEGVLPVADAPLHTKFVVTLDGVDPSSIFKKAKTDMNSQIVSKNKRIFSSIPQENEDEAMYDNDLELVETEIDFEMEEEDDDDDDDGMICLDYPNQNHILIPTNILQDSCKDSDIVEKKNVRCQYWPACSRGENCIFIHPSKLCKNFPSCAFGSKCINIHPNCKFDSQCTRPDCPFTHASKRTPIPSHHVPILKQPKFIIPVTKPPITTVCKYFPKCTNSKCPFIHPKLCRYGSFCKTPTCPFTHPKTPSVEKLKWVANKTDKS